MRTRHALCASALLVLLCIPPASAQWEPVGEAGAAYAVAVHGNLVFAGLQGDSIYVSGDQGDTWAATNTGITNSSNWWLSSIDGNVYCGTQFGPLFRSTDDGASWEDIGLNGVRGLAEHNDTLYACTWYGPSVHWSVDEGDNWNPTAALSGSGGLWPLISYHGYLFVGGQGGGVFRIQHSGDAWEPMNIGLGNLNAYAFAAIGDLLFVGTTAGIWRSTDDGASWQTTGMTGGTVYDLHTVGTQLLSGGDFGIFLSPDSGATWTAFNTGLTSALTSRLTSDASYLYAGGYQGGGVHRRSLIEIGTGLADGTTVHERPAVFPVPALDHVQLSWPAHVAVQYRIRTLAGELAADGAIRHGSIGIDQLPAGAYLLEVSDRSGERAVLRLVKQ